MNENSIKQDNSSVQEDGISELQTETKIDTSKFTKISLPFIENQGQTHSDVKFYTNTFAGTVFVTNDDLLYSLNSKEGQTYIFKEKFLNSPALRPVGLEKNDATVNYFVGQKDSWRSGVSTYNSVSLGELWPMVDVELKAHGKNLEKIFKVKPGGKVSDIRVAFDGITGLAVDANRQLLVGIDTISMTKPIAFQYIDDKRIDVDVSYVIEENSYGFKVEKYDPNNVLIIDPLLDSTFVGGSLDDVGQAITIDDFGHVYITGYTFSSNYPTAGTFDSSHNGGADVFVSKLDSDLDTLIASTFIGGSDDEFPADIDIDSLGNVYVTGYTFSSDYPTAGTYDSSHNGGADVFVSKLDSSLTMLSDSTFIGGSLDDIADAIWINDLDKVYVTGSTASSDYPTVGAYDSTFNGSVDVFISKLDSDLDTLIASTFIGGSDVEHASSIAIDALSNVYITGYTFSSDYPTAGTYDSSHNGGADVFVSYVNGTLSTLIESTFVGGISDDFANDIVIDDIVGSVYITGETSSSDFPTAGTFDSSHNGGGDVFVANLDSGLDTLIASTFVGGTDFEAGNAIDLDSLGNVYVAGSTESSDYPTVTHAFDSSFNGGSGEDPQDAFISKLDSSLNLLTQSTFVGGSDQEAITSLIVTDSDTIYVTGHTGSSDFPTAGTFDSSHNGGGDSFVSHFSNLLAEPGPIPGSGDVFVAVANDQVQRHDEDDGSLVDILTTVGGEFSPGFTTGMAFDDFGRLYVTEFSNNQISRFDSTGTLLGTFGSGFTDSPESIVFDINANAFVGHADGTADIHKYDFAGSLLTTFDPATESRGTDWIDLSDDQCTVFYTSEGTTVKRFDVCNNMQLSDFATGLHGPAFALRLLPDGGLLVADSVDIHRLDSAGTIIQTYDAAGQDDWFALNLDPDGTSFWSADFTTSDVFKFDIDSGSELFSFNTGTDTFTVFGLVVEGEITFASARRPAIISIVASDPDAADAIYSAGDIITVLFSLPTNILSLAGGDLLLTKSELDTLFTFSQDLGDDFIGRVISPSLLEIEIVDITNATPPVVGVLTITPKPDSGLTNAEGSAPASTEPSPPLEGSFGDRAGPLITALVAHDPKTVPVGGFDAGDTITARFNEGTDQAGFGAAPITLTKSQVDAIFDVSQNLGANYNGRWENPSTFITTILDPTGSAPPTVGTLTLTVKASAGLQNAAETSLASTATSPPLSGSFSGFRATQEVTDGGTASTTLPSGIDTSITLPGGESGTVVTFTTDASEVGAAGATLSFLGNQPFDIEPPAGACAPPNVCTFTAGFNDDDLDAAGIVDLDGDGNRVDEVKWFHDKNDDGDFADAGEELATIVTPSTPPGPYIATATDSFTSKFAVGGIRPLFLGGLSGEFAPPLVKSITIDGTEYKLEQYSNTIPTITLETGKKIQSEIPATDSGGAQSIQHVSLYMNLRGLQRDLQYSDTYIIYDKGNPVQVVDPHGYFALVNVTPTTSGTILKLSFDITFAKPMEKTDLIIRTWDDRRNSFETKVFDAMQVTGPEISSTTSTESVTTQESTQTTQQTTQNIPSWVKNNAGWWSDGQIGDSDFVSGIQYMINQGIMKIPETEAGQSTSQNIPSWIKSNAGWWKDGLISDSDFVQGIQWLISNGIMRIG